MCCFRINGTTILLSHLEVIVANHCATVVMLSINTSFNSKGICYVVTSHLIILSVSSNILIIKFSMYIIIIPHFFTIASFIYFLVVESPLYYSNSIPVANPLFTKLNMYTLAYTLVYTLVYLLYIGLTIFTIIFIMLWYVTTRRKV